MDPDEVVGHVWADYALVDDGAGGKFLEPQKFLPIRFRDLSPEMQASLGHRLAMAAPEAHTAEAVA